MVELGMRYLCAYNEINARLQVRHNLLVAYITVTFTVIGFLIATLNSTSVGHKSSVILIVGLAFGLPILGFLFVLFIGYNDISIALLNRFCYECENLSKTEQPIPAWNSPNQKWLDHAILFRGILVNALAFVQLFVCIVVPLYVFWYEDSQDNLPNWLSWRYLFITSSIIAIISWVAMWLTGCIRDDIHNPDVYIFKVGKQGELELIRRPSTSFLSRHISFNKRRGS